MISILTTNRNAAIIIDSDKKNRQHPLNTTKKRIIDEFKELQMFSWVTKGKEIENYISAATVNTRFGSDEKQCGQYELFPDYINPYYKGFASKKVQFAIDICPYITFENTKGYLDLEEKIMKLSLHIAKWNGSSVID